MFCEESGCENYASHRASMGDTIEWEIQCRACPCPGNTFRFPIAYEKMLERCAERKIPYDQGIGNECGVWGKV